MFHVFVCRRVAKPLNEIKLFLGFVPTFSEQIEYGFLKFLVFHTPSTLEQIKNIRRKLQTVNRVAHEYKLNYTNVV